MTLDPQWLVGGLLVVISGLIVYIWQDNKRQTRRDIEHSHETQRVLFAKIDDMHDEVHESRKAFEAGMNERRAHEGEIRREVGDLRDRVGKIETTCVILHGKSVGSEHPEKE